MDAADVEILRCGACGAPVPLGTGDVAACGHCQAEVVLPAAHRALRRLAVEDEGRRAQAERVLDGLDRPPSWPVKALATILDLPMMAFLLVYGIPLGLLSIVFGIRVATWIAASVGLPSGDADMPTWLGLTTVLGLITVTTFVPRALGVYANRRMTARARLLAALEARPAATPGGPAGCRQCGAPLEMPVGARVARCLYCQAESALRIDTPHLEDVSGHVVRLGRSVVDAVPRDHAERRATLRQLGAEAGRYVLTGGVFALLFGVYGWDADRARAAGGSDAPGLGLGALVMATLLFIGLIMRSLASREDTRAEAKSRRRRK